MGKLTMVKGGEPLFGTELESSVYMEEGPGQEKEREGGGLSSGRRRDLHP